MICIFVVLANAICLLEGGVWKTWFSVTITIIWILSFCITPHHITPLHPNPNHSSHYKAISIYTKYLHTQIQ